MDDIEKAAELRRKYTHFRILVIGRANAGKTTLLKRVCNTMDEPCIFDEKSNNLLEPTSERGIHDIHRPFAFASNPQFIFHDSPGFEAGGEEELLAVQSFIEERARSTEVKDQLHAIWYCLVTDNARPLLPLEKRFFNETRAGNAPVIAIFTKFDDLITQVYDMDQEEEKNREDAMRLLEEKFRKPLSKYKFPPQANVCFEAIHEDEGDHQDQVKELMSQTAAALNSLALQMLFVSVQQNNLDLCIKYAIEHSPLFVETKGSNCSMKNLVGQCLQWFKHSYYISYDYGSTETDDYEERDGERLLEEVGERLDEIELEKQELERKENEACGRLFGSDVKGPVLGLERRLEERRRARGVQELFRQRKLNTKSITILTNHIFPNSLLFALSAILICLKLSFLPPFQSPVFIKAFHQAFQLYTEDSTQEEVEREISNLGVYPANHTQQKAFKSNLLQIILHYFLSYDGHSQSSN